MVQETLDQVLSIRKAWRFNRGERRVRRLPTLAYDSLQPDTNGMATADTVDVYNGAPDHYEWALLGKREMLVPYNSYAVHQKGLAYGDILKSRFINPDLLRYELHRVWVVEATLRKGFSHPYAKRRFYLDEDSWQILAADIYDKDGVLTRPGGPSDQLLRCAAGLQHPGSDLRLQGRPLLRRWAGQQRADVRLRRAGRAARLHPQALRREGN